MTNQHDNIIENNMPPAYSMKKHKTAGVDTQAFVFDYLKKNPNKTSVQISEILGIEKKVVDLTIKKLIKGGFIEFKRNNFTRAIKKIKEKKHDR